MSIDFKANQIRTSQIIATGSSLGPSLVIYGKGATTNFIGGTTFPGASLGSDSFLYVSGAIGLRGVSGTSGSAVFGGDTVVSGTFYGLRSLQVSGSSGLTGSLVIKDDTGDTAQLTLSSSAGSITFDKYEDGNTYISDNVAGGEVWLSITAPNGIGANVLRVVPKNTGQSVVLFSSGSLVSSVARDPLSVGDTNFYVEGIPKTRGGSTRGTAVFGGDLVSSGTVVGRLGLTGSLTKLVDGSSYLIAGTNVTITTGSSGAVTISAAGGSGSPGGADTYVQFNDAGSFQGNPGLVFNKSTETVSARRLDVTGTMLTVTGTVDIRVPEVSLAFNVRSDGSPETPLFTIDADGLGVGFNGTPIESYEFNKLRGNELDKVLFLSGGSPSSSDIRKTADVNFFVSGSIAGRGTSGTSLFGGDLVASGSLFGLNGIAEFRSDTAAAKLTLASNNNATEVGQSTAGNLTIRNQTSGGEFTLSAKTSGGVTNNFIDFRPLGGLTGSILSVFPSSIYAGAANPFNASDTNFFVAGGRNKKDGVTGGTSVFGGDLVISGSTFLGTDNTDRVKFNAQVSSDIIPDGNRTRNLGSDTARFANVFTGDLHLKNERGDYTLIEEEDCLTIRFNKTGKRYKFVLESAPEFDE